MLSDIDRKTPGHIIIGNSYTYLTCGFVPRISSDAEKLPLGLYQKPKWIANKNVRK